MKKPKMNFLKMVISDKRVGAVASSSKYVIGMALRGLHGRSLHKVVEYGPGDGAMTRELLNRLSPDGQVLAIESNEEFVAILKEIKDSRLRVVKGSIQEVSTRLSEYGFNNVDAILASIPFFQLSHADRDKIAKNSFDSLAVGGSLIIFHQYTPLMASALKKVFKKVHVSFEPRNLLPWLIIRAEKT